MKKLYRARKGKWIAGVCSGLAKYFNIDPKLVRVFFIVMVLAFSSSLIVYIILMIVIPKEPKYIK